MSRFLWFNTRASILLELHFAQPTLFATSYNGPQSSSTCQSEQGGQQGMHLATVDTIAPSMFSPWHRWLTLPRSLLKSPRSSNLPCRSSSDPCNGSGVGHRAWQASEFVASHDSTNLSSSYRCFAHDNVVSFRTSSLEQRSHYQYSTTTTGNVSLLRRSICATKEILVRVHL
jgi:hypothetical protein